MYVAYCKPVPGTGQGATPAEINEASRLQDHPARGDLGAVRVGSQAAAHADLAGRHRLGGEPPPRVSVRRDDTPDFHHAGLRRNQPPGHLPGLPAPGDLEFDHQPASPERHPPPPFLIRFHDDTLADTTMPDYTGETA